MRHLSTRSWGIAAFIALCIASLAPIVLSRYLPFCDMYGVMGSAAAYFHRGDSTKLVDPYYTFSASASATALYFAVVVALAHVMPIWIANSLFIVVFIVLLPPLAMIYTLRAFGRDWRLALLVFAAIYHGVVWNGFMGAAASYGLIVLALGLAYQLCRPGPRRAEGGALLLTSLTLAAAHSFMALIGLGLCTLVVIADDTTMARRARALAAMVPGYLYIAHWLATYFPSHGDGGSRGVSTAIGALLRHGQGSLDEVHRWFIEGIVTTHLDDVLALFAGLSIVALLVFGVRGSVTELDGPPRPRAGRRTFIAWSVLVLVVALYFILPQVIAAPVYWWALRVRVIPLAFFLSLLCVRSSPRGLPWFALAPTLALSLAWSLYLAGDLRGYFNGRQLAGFDAIVDRIPSGKRVLFLHDPNDIGQHYARASYAYLMQNYVERSGGIAWPHMRAGQREIWASSTALHAPEWGVAAQFDWHTDAETFDYIVVKDREHARTPKPTSFSPANVFEPIAREGLWSLFRVIR